MRIAISLLFLISTFGFLQSTLSQDTLIGYHQHDGFYLSLNGGLGIGNIVLDATNAGYNTMKISGDSYHFDIKIGYVVSESSNLIVSLDALEKVISDPIVTLDGASPTSGTMLHAIYGLLGLGITKYFMPANVFLSATIGEGTYRVNISNKLFASRNGLGYQLKCGKEWWVLDNWGIGVAAGVGYLSTKANGDPSDPSYSGKYSATSFFVLFNTTFN